MRIDSQEAIANFHRKKTKASLLRFNEANADGFRTFDGTARGGQGTRFRVDTKHGNVVRALVGSEEKDAGRIDTEVARRLSPGRFPLNESQFADLLVDDEDGDTVVTTVGTVDELAGGVYAYLGG